MEKFRTKAMGEVKNFMGLNVRIDRNLGELTIDQSRYVEAILQKF